MFSKIIMEFKNRYKSQFLKNVSKLNLGARVLKRNYYLIENIIDQY